MALPHFGHFTLDAVIVSTIFNLAEHEGQTTAVGIMTSKEVATELRYVRMLAGLLQATGARSCWHTICPICWATAETPRPSRHSQVKNRSSLHDITDRNVKL